MIRKCSELRGQACLSFAAAIVHLSPRLVRPAPTAHAGWLFEPGNPQLSRLSLCPADAI